MRRDQQRDDLPVATLPRFGHGTIAKSVQIVLVQLDDLWVRF